MKITGFTIITITLILLAMLSFEAFKIFYFATSYVIYVRGDPEGYKLKKRTLNYNLCKKEAVLLLSPIPIKITELNKVYG